MSGIEMGAVASAAAKAGEAAGRALTGGEAETTAIREIAKTSTGAQVAGAAMGDRMAVKQLTINRLLAPLFWFTGYRREYFEGGSFAEDLATKMQEVPEENMISPAPNVAAQAMEGLSYSLDEPDLKEMYLNLLGTASDSRRANDAHPSYAGVIRQLSATEARLLPQFLSSSHGEPMAEIRLVATNEIGGFHTIVRHVVDLRAPDTGEPIAVPGWPLFVDNWVRLGLVVADYGNFRVGEHAYDFVQHRPEYSNVELNDVDFKLDFQKGLLRTTDFGLRFGRAVLPVGAS